MEMMRFLIIILGFPCIFATTRTTDFCRGNEYALGISANIRKIPDSAITASTEYTQNCYVSYHGRLHFQEPCGNGVWCALYNDVNQYLQIDLSKNYVITGAATQGANGYAEYVTSYQLQYSEDGSGTWRYYQINGVTETLQGNNGGGSNVVKHILNPFTARIVRFRPQTYVWHTCMRVELYGCEEKATNPTTSTFCLADRFGVSIKKSISSFTSVTLKDPSCVAKSNATHITLSTTFSECATSKNETKDYIVVSNEVRMLGDASGMITRANNTIIPFACKYSRSGLEISLSSFQPKVKSVVQAQESGFGNFTLSFRMARSDLFGSYFDTYPVAVQINDRLYFQVTLNANNTDTALLIERCDATPSLNKNDAIKYPLISNRCPIDKTTMFHSGAIHHKKFSFQAFNFLNNVPIIYLHCEVYLCHHTSQDSRCTSGCDINKVRRRRDFEKREIHAGSSEIYVVENGPIQKSKKQQGNQSPNTAVPVTLIAMGVGVAVLVIVLVGLGFKVAKMKSLTTVKPPPPDHGVKENQREGCHMEMEGEDIQSVMNEDIKKNAMKDPQEQIC